ncbi:unnamed protein product [Merluccius merluccius]
MATALPKLPIARSAAAVRRRLPDFPEPGPPQPRTPMDWQESLGFQDRRMVDNELYSFRSTDGFNTIRLSGADQQDGARQARREACGGGVMVE